MAKKKRSTRKSTKASDDGFFSRFDFDWARFRRGAIAAGWVLAVIAVVYAWTRGVPRLERHAAAMNAEQTIDIRFVEPPAWMNGELEALLDVAVREHLTTDPFARDDLAAAHAALEATGWFDTVHQVRRVNAGRIDVEAEFVRPFALIRGAVRSGGDVRDHLVDPRGKRLPRSYPTDRKQGFVTITGARFSAPADAGAQWDGADVTAGLRLLRLIHDRPWRHQVASVDVSRYLTEESLSLVTNRGCRILWGRQPGDEAGLEVEADHKLRYLDFNFSEHGHIDRGYTTTIDITGDVVTVR